MRNNDSARDSARSDGRSRSPIADSFTPEYSEPRELVQIQLQIQNRASARAQDQLFRQWPAADVDRDICEPDENNNTATISFKNPAAYCR